MKLVGDSNFDQFVWFYIDLAFVAVYEGNVEKAIELSRAGSLLPADRHDRFCLAAWLYFEVLAGHAKQAMIPVDEVVATVEAAGNPSIISFAFAAKGKAYAEHDPVLALTFFERSIAIARSCGSRLMETLAIPDFAALQALSGEPTKALGSFLDMLKVWRGATDLLILSSGLGNLIVLFDRLGCFTAAATLHGKLANEMDFGAFAPELAAASAHIRTTMGDKAFDAADNRGRALSLEDAVAYAESKVREALAAARNEGSNLSG